jgi:hypothetical protein
MNFPPNISGYVFYSSVSWMHAYAGMTGNPV